MPAVPSTSSGQGIASCPAPFITLDAVTLRVRDRFILADTHWHIQTGQSWAVVGPNGCGKSTLVKALIGQVAVVKGHIIRHSAGARPDKIGYISFEQQRDLIAREVLGDMARCFSTAPEAETTARQLFEATGLNKDDLGSHLGAISDTFGLDVLMERRIRALSNGEMRKILIARALAKDPQLLILDEPFDGLDQISRSHLKTLLMQLMARKVQLILVTHRHDEILPGINHLLELCEGKVVRQSTLAPHCTPTANLAIASRPPLKTGVACSNLSCARPASSELNPEVLVAMHDTTVRYGKTVVLDRLRWQMRRGEHWALWGPNGCGKTTLLSLICGDHLHAYANEIYFLGRRRGSGESIWDIKRNIGLISSEFQFGYRKPTRAVNVVLSGLFDSVGLYRRTSAGQQAAARAWLETFKISELADTPFGQLSYGQQRMVLLARSMIKEPLLLILDEPSQGLDLTNRRLLFEAVEWIGQNTGTHLLCATHYADEIPACTTHLMQFQKTSSGHYAVARYRMADWRAGGHP